MEHPSPLRFRRDKMLERYLSPLKEFGPADGVLYAVDRLLARMSPALRLYCYEFMVQPVPAHRMLPPRVSERFEVRQITHGDPEVALMPARPDIKEARFAQNAACLGAFRNGEFVGYIWFAFREYQEDEVRCTFVVHPPASAAFDFDLYIFPEHRMSFAFLAIWDEANAFLRARGIRHTFSRLTRFNAVSRRAHLKLGARPVGRGTCVKMWRLEIMVASVFPYFHASLSPASRARIALHSGTDASRGVRLRRAGAVEEPADR